MTNPVGGGSVSQPIDRIEQRVRELQRELRALARRDLSSVSVGIGGRMSVKHPNGNEAVIFGGDPDDETGASKFRINDNVGLPMMSADAKAGYGLGNPVFPFPFAGYESLNMNGATSQGTATQIGEGTNWLYNPAILVIPRIRIVATSAVTVNVFCKWSGISTAQFNSTERVYTFAGAATQVNYATFTALLAAPDMKAQASARFFAYCSVGVGANVSMTLSYSQGFGCSKGYYDISTAFV